VAELIGAHPLDVIFTSCATESNNTAIAAALRATGVPPVQGQTQTRAGRPCHVKRHIVTSQVEHSSVLNYCMALEKSKAPLLIQEGWRGSDGVVTVQQGRPSPDGRGGYRQARFSTTPAQGASPSSSEEGSRLSARSVTEGGYRVTYLPVDREGLLFVLI
jgi:hypothetical protein